MKALLLVIMQLIWFAASVYLFYIGEKTDALICVVISVQAWILITLEDKK